MKRIPQIKKEQKEKRLKAEKGISQPSPKKDLTVKNIFTPNIQQLKLSKIYS